MGEEIAVVNEALHSRYKLLIDAGYFFHRKFTRAVSFKKRFKQAVSVIIHILTSLPGSIIDRTGRTYKRRAWRFFHALERGKHEIR